MTYFSLLGLLCGLMDEKLGRAERESEELSTYVKGRAGHEKRYESDASKLEKELVWKPCITFAVGLSKTVAWYLDNQNWVEKVTSGSYKHYYETMYVNL